MQVNGVCDPQCNLRECGYDSGDCTAQQVQSACLERQERAGIDYSDPQGTVPVTVTVTPRPARLEISEELNEMVRACMRMRLRLSAQDEVACTWAWAWA